ncbi:MAG: glycosyltransferase [Acidimicrobiales bacterium]
MNGSSSARRRDVVVAVCTCRRPGPLRRLLDRLTEEAARSASLVRVGVAIVDDGPAREAEAVADAFADRFELGVRYSSTASGNISTARNAAVDAAVALVGALGWVCCIDDDCLPCDGWFDLLFAVRDATDAELVTGPVHDVPPPGAPAWLTEQPFLNLIGDYDDLTEPPYGTAANMLVAADWLLTHPEVRFRPELGRIGGEDMVWFADARAAGVVHRYAVRAEVTERLPPSRATMRYQVRSKLWFGNTMYVTNLEAGTPPGRLLLRGAKQFVTSIVRPLVRVAHGESPQVRSAVATAAIGVGLMSGRFGVRLDHH